LGATLERDNRRDLDTGTEFQSYSPTRYGLWVWGAWPFSDSWRLESKAQYRTSRYADPERRGGITLDTRSDDEIEAMLRIRYRATPSWYAFAEYSYTDNDSNFSEFSYARRILSLGAQRSF
jgi:hypothetical protein